MWAKMKKRTPFLLLLFLFSSLLFSQERAFKVVAHTPEGKILRLYKECHALVIGISDYLSGWPDLPNAVRDADEIGDLLSELGFKVTRVKNPTKSQLVQKLDAFIYGPGQKEDNCIVIFFAGHGHTVEMTYGPDMGYIVPKDTPSPLLDKANFMQKAISMEIIQAYARSIQAKHALFLFDSCFSGAIFDIARAIPEAISSKTEKPVRQFITAGGADETVPDRSVFKIQLIKGLRGDSDLNKDGYVTGTELGEFLQDTVINYSRGGQHPQYGKIRDPILDRGDFVFILVDRTEETVKPVEPVKPKVTLKPKYGSLELYIDIPGAKVYLDGEYQGITKEGYAFEISELFVGSHTIRISHEGYKDYETSVRIYGDKRERLAPKLKPIDPTVKERLKTEKIPKEYIEKFELPKFNLEQIEKQIKKLKSNRTVWWIITIPSYIWTILNIIDVVGFNPPFGKGVAGFHITGVISGIIGTLGIVNILNTGKTIKKLREDKLQSQISFNINPPKKNYAVSLILSF